MVINSSIEWDLVKNLEDLVNTKWKFQFRNLLFQEYLPHQPSNTVFEPSL
jgi:hypothetical protein